MMPVYRVLNAVKGAGERGHCTMSGIQALTARAKLDGVVLGDVAVPPQVEARALRVLLRGAVLGHERGQPMFTHVLRQHESLLDQVLEY